MLITIKIYSLNLKINKHTRNRTPNPSIKSRLLYPIKLCTLSNFDFEQIRTVDMEKPFWIYSPTL